MSWHNTPIALMAKALAAKEVSSTELTQYFLDRIEAGKQWNAYLDVNAHLSLEQANKADQLISSGKAGKLTGIPVAHKDVFVTRGWNSTAASKILAGYQSPFDATVVANLGIPDEDNPHGAGMVCLGKTNMDEFAMGSSNENSAFGPVLNPWNAAHVAGGSSGGSAAAVAAGLAPIATGTDTGGSIRQPAAFCGLTGIKPSYGRVSRYGMVYKGSVRVGGDKFDEAITNYIRRNYGMLIGEQTAELIKKTIGSAFPGAEVREMEVKGRNLSEGIPRSFTVTSNEILEALTDPLNQIVTAVKAALEQIPPELASDIAERGMMLTGGGALLRDLDRLLLEETGLPIHVAEDPLTCVARGCGIALERMDKLGGVFSHE
jgi:hypothetical protein